MGKRRSAAVTAAGRSGSENGEKREVKGKRRSAAAAAGRSGSEDGEKREVKKAKGKRRSAAAAGRSGSVDGENREVKKAKVGDSSPPTVVCDVIPPINSVDSSQAQLPVIYVQFHHCSPRDAPNKSLFSQFGEIDDFYRVSIRNDFIFIPYKTRDGATKAVEEPLKKLEGGGELVCFSTPCALLQAIRQTVLDKVTPLLDQLHHHSANTRVYVCNVHYQTDPDVLKALFSQFGEITSRPLLFGVDPDWEIVYYLIVYKTEEGAKEALKQPSKQFGGHQLHCTSDVEDVVKTAQKEVLEEIQTSVDRLRNRIHQQRDAAKTKPQLLQQQDSKTRLAFAINDVLAAAGRFKTAADLAVAAAERLNCAVDLISTQLQGSGAGAGATPG